MKEKLSRFLLIFLVGAALPLILLFLSVDAILLAEADYREEHEKASLKKDLETLLVESEPIFFSQKVARLAFEKIAQAGFAQNSIASVSATLKAEARGKMELFVFGRSGKLVYADDAGKHLAMSELWKIHGGDIDDPGRYYYERPGIFFPVIGSFFPVEAFAEKSGNSFLIKHPGKTVFLHRFFAMDSDFGMVVLAEDLPDSSSTAIRLFSDLSDAGNKDILVTFHDGEILHSGPAPHVKEDFAQIINGMRLRDLSFMKQDGFLWHQKAFDGRIFLLGRTSSAKNSGHGWHYVVTILLLIVILHLMYQWIVMEKPFYFSVRLKLPLLFLYLVSIPVTGMIFLSLRMYRTQEEHFSAQIVSQALEEVHAIEKGFETELQACLDVWRGLILHPAVKAVRVDELDLMINELRNQKVLDMLELADIDGRILYPATTVETEEMRGVQISRDINHDLTVKNFLPERVARSSSADSPARMFRDEVISNFSPMFAGNKINQINLLHLGPYSILTFQDVSHDFDSPVAKFYIQLRNSTAVDRYLSGLFEDIRKHYAGHVLTHNAVSGVWKTKGFEHSTSLQDFARRAWLFKQPLHSKIEIAGAPFILVAARCEGIEGTVVLALYPFAEIQHRLDTTRRQIFTGVAVALFLTLVLSLLLSATFLNPLKEMFLGVSALKNRDTVNRIASISSDELGEVAEAFNKTVEELEELELAQVVQRNLFPQSFPGVEGYDFEFFNLPASKLGGDYCDALVLENGSVLFLVADAAGHGIPAALMVAIAKAAVFLGSETCGDIKIILSELDKVLKALGKKSSMMSIFMGMLDVAENKVIYSNAGHPYPLLVKADGVISEIEMTRFPLGSRSSKPFAEQVLSMDEGDLLLLFSDGLFEAMNAGNEPFAYRGIKSAINSCEELTADGVRNALVKSLSDHAGSGKYEDDVTIAILRRQKSKEKRQ